MGILGLTHDENGTALEKLPVTIKVAIGEGPEPGNGENHPRKLDHFVFKRKALRGQDVVWEPAADITKAHGEKPTEVGIIFLNDEPREVLRTEYAWWTPGGCRCHGELVQIADAEGVRFEMRATRRTQEHPEGEPWPENYTYAEGPKAGQPVEPCGDGCPDLERGDCKPSGDLYFILEKFPTFGAICRLHTSSYRSIRNLSNGLMQIRRMNGGRLTGIKAILKASPERIAYSDRGGTRRTSVAYILSLEVAGTDLRTLVANMTEPARLLRERRPTIELTRGVQYVVRETDAERAQEISSEFYPQAEESARTRASRSESGDQLARICELARRLGFNEAKTRMLIGQFLHGLAGLERRLLTELVEQPEATHPDVCGCQQTETEPRQAEGARPSTSSVATDSNKTRPHSQPEFTEFLRVHSFE
jgi:hypothetical protein